VLAAAMSCHIQQWMWMQRYACVSATEAYQDVCLAETTLAVGGQQCGTHSMHVSTIETSPARIWLHGSPPGHSSVHAVRDLRL
jgi:hypothetical protein